MVGNRKDYGELITAEEIVKLSLDFGTSETFAICDKIIQEYERKAPTSRRNDRYFYMHGLFSALYDGGKIQGIREERARAKERTYRHKINPSQ